MALAPGARLGPYEILALLGQGGMGEVYRARAPRLGRDVAIKVVSGEGASDPARRARFELEARAAAALNHPHILAVHDIGTAHLAGGPTPYVVSELLEGETLRERLTRGKLPVRVATELAVQIARALAAAHEHGIVHRDIKPENLFVTKDGTAKVLDFGLAKLRDAGVPAGDMDTTVEAHVGTEPGVVLGTVGYMAPEQVRAVAVDHRADLFALGCVLYELLGGQRAFHGASGVETLHAILHAEPPDLATLVPGLSGGLDRRDESSSRTDQPEFRRRALLPPLRPILGPGAARLPARRLQIPFGRGRRPPRCAPRPARLIPSAPCVPVPSATSASRCPTSTPP